MILSDIKEDMNMDDNCIHLNRYKYIGDKDLEDGGTDMVCLSKNDEAAALVPVDWFDYILRKGTNGEGKEYGDFFPVLIYDIDAFNEWYQIIK